MYSIFRRKPFSFVILGLIVTCLTFYTISYYILVREKSQPIHAFDRTGSAGSYYLPGFIEPRRNICANGSRDVKLLMLVSTPPLNNMSRMAIRATWGRRLNISDSVAVAFVIGVSGIPDVNEMVQQEGNKFSDIIQAKFLDNYYNLTLKTMSMLQWASEYCPKAKFVLKADDDMYINTPKLLKFVDKHLQEDNAVFGKLMRITEPVRDPSSKYYTSFEEFRPRCFPDFLTGGAYLLPGALAQPLYNMSLEMPFLKLEDAFMTGLVADALGIRRVNVPEFSNTDMPTDVCNVRWFISIHEVKPSQLYSVWKKLFDPDDKCETVF